MYVCIFIYKYVCMHIYLIDSRGRNKAEVSSTLKVVADDYC